MHDTLDKCPQIDVKTDTGDEFTYRNKATSRPQLLRLRKTLIDKCEEIIARGKWQYGTNEIYRDLISFTKNTET